MHVDDRRNDDMNDRVYDLALHLFRMADEPSRPDKERDRLVQAAVLLTARHQAAQKWMHRMREMVAAFEAEDGQEMFSIADECYGDWLARWRRPRAVTAVHNFQEEL